MVRLGHLESGVWNLGAYDQKGEGQFVAVGMEVVDEYDQDDGDDDGRKKTDEANPVEGNRRVGGGLDGGFGAHGWGAGEKGRKLVL